MKKTSQISIALVCAILGFMLSYQFKSIVKQEKTLNITSKSSEDVTVEIDQYKKEKVELEKKVDELQGKLKDYENKASSKSDATKNLIKELETTRLLIGNTNVEGPGVVIYLNPINDIFGSAPSDKLTDKHLVYLVNELRFAGAESIAINGIRIVNRTGIRIAGNYIMINGERVSPNKRITIEAIGNKDLLYATLDFPEVFESFKAICDIKYEKKDSIKMSKYNKVYKNEYAKPVEEK
ncbi:DUF881 domain-containing protein [Clostridium botulinum]|uniref:Membrane protein n=7 Tax=Clostridium botulinum TaxID=1491 RepID=A5I1U1_CLOBH|nr:DUF881 domain-containing protein [Clostridium botulinum]AJD26135.1 hypothetical protein T257_226 [Clostridium botulinum CDC_297]EKN41638.1 hypothetical protein CFSAN001627_11883 [Clostridium botulinum CFSAN001627]EKX78091.1 hypothetical protein CFSAN001628_021610 [Clostridium botulinum CFSAN001628]KRU30431.1 dihydropteridine reductase [Clostridium sporogenes]ABS35295.1 conserved hypothetical protein [Clostridium botulinum A str. ATCC 19397]